ncbi:autophagy-related protein 2 [Rhodotorula sphaerocarpa]
MPWPSFDSLIAPLASAASYLPSLPSVVVPAKLQQRLVAFLLRRAIGRFVKGGGHSLGDEGRIEADVRNGRFVVRGLEVDEAAIDSILSPTSSEPSHSTSPVRFEGGKIDQLTTLVSWPLSQLDVQVDNVELVFRVADRPSAPFPPSTTSTGSSHPASGDGRPSSDPSPGAFEQDDLAESHVSLAIAHDFVSHKLLPSEDAELRASLHLSPSTASVDLPGAFGGGARSSPASPGEEAQAEEVEATMLAGVIERVLAKLRVRVQHVRVRLLWDVPHPEDASSAIPHELELLIDEIEYVGDASEGAATQTAEPLTIAKRLKVTPPQVYLKTRTSPPPATTARRPCPARSYSSSSSSASEDENDLLAMSQSIADLRTSTVDSRSDVFASATSHVFEPVAEEEEDGKPGSGDPFLGPDSATNGRPSPSDAADTQVERLVSFGSDEPFVLNVRTKPAGDNKSGDPTSSARTEIGARLDSDIVVVARPENLAVLFDLASRWTNAVDQEAEQPRQSAPHANQRVRRRDLRASCSVPALHLFLLSRLDATAPDHLWSRPATGLNAPHIHLVLNELAAEYRQPLGGLEASLGSFTVTETFSSEAGVMRTLPLLLSDPALAVPSLDQWPDVEIPSADWRTRPAGFYGKDWRVVPRAAADRLRHAQSSPPAAGSASSPSQPAVRYLHCENVVRPELEIDAVHTFVDLQILTRHTDLLQLLAVTDSSVTPSSESAGQRASDRVSRTSGPPSDSDHKGALATSCSLLRVEVRCPAPATMRRRAQHPDLLRGGRVVLDFCNVNASLGKGAAEIRMGDMRAYLASPAATRARAILALSTLDTHEDGVGAFKPLLRYTAATLQTQGPVQLDVEVPLVRVALRKASFDALQLLADDLSCFFTKELPASRSSQGDAGRSWSAYNKLIGSRFFGAKSYVRPRGGRRQRADDTDTESVAESTASEATMTGLGRGGPQEPARRAMRLALTVTDTIVDVALGQSEPSAQDDNALRTLRLTIADLKADGERLVGAEEDLSVKLAAMDWTLREYTGPAESRSSQSLLSRSFSQNPMHRPEPTVRLVFSSSTERETRVTESKVQLSLADTTIQLGPDLTWVRGLLDFVRAPDGVFEEVVPNELLRLRVALQNVSIEAAVPLSPTVVVLALADVRLRSDMSPDQLRTVFKIESSGSKVLAIAGSDDRIVPSVERGSEKEKRLLRHWTARGFVPIVNDLKFDMQVRMGNGLVLPELDLVLEHLDGNVSVCADTVAPLAHFAASFGELARSFAAEETSEAGATGRDSRSTAQDSAAAINGSRDLLASLDQSAFGHLPRARRQPSRPRKAAPVAGPGAPAASPTVNGSRVSGVPAETGRKHGDEAIVSNVDGETITMFAPDGLRVVDGWLEEPHVESHMLPSSDGVSTRCVVRNANLNVYLHEGYDWADTRKAILERTRTVRRRLEKIRQLRASGQTPDSSVDEASVVMFGSVQLGLPPGSNDLSPKELLAAIDQELGDGTEVDEQTLAIDARPERSTSAAVQLRLHGLSASLDIFEGSDELSRNTSTRSEAEKSRLDVRVAELEIIDNVKTSTWHKFLSELRPSDGGTLRPSNSPMARAEIKAMRGDRGPGNAPTEFLLKAKVAPLRLYVDQDALDFLKAFGAFEAPPHAQRSAPAGLPAPLATFYERVEILPVKLKVDYKPKRINFNALRAGKTAELLNLFHFEAAEMTLRHLVVTGVSGTSTLSTLIQDIWTPDVKANQLAEVVSGIAPLRSVVNVGSGVANLVLLPIEQYRKDGRIVRGLQKGAQAFTKQTTLEAIHAGAKLANGTQVILEQAEHVLGGKFSRSVATESIVSAARSDEAEDTEGTDDELSGPDPRSRYATQPANLRQGVQGAYRSFGDNLKDAAQTILAVPMEVYEPTGEEGAVRAVVRAVPLAVLKPMIGASGAVSKALLGLRNTLDPHAQQNELQDKYKPSTPPASGPH